MCEVVTHELPQGALLLGKLKGDGPYKYYIGVRDVKKVVYPMCYFVTEDDVIRILDKFVDKLKELKCPL